jgi:hypothetical protein
MFGRHKKMERQSYDRENEIPVLHCSICNGEQVAGFKNIHTGQFTECMLIRNDEDLQVFKDTYGVTELSKEY